MGLLDDAIREHLDLKRRRGADPAEIERAEREALGPVRRGPEEVEPLEPDEAMEHPDDDLAYEDEPSNGWGESFDEETRLFGEEREPSFGHVPPAPAPEQIAPEPALEPRAPEPHYDEPEYDEPDESESEEEFEEERPSSRQEPAPPEPPAAAPSRAHEPPAHDDEPPAHDDEPSRSSEHFGEETAEYDVAKELDKDTDDVLEETPEFLQDTPDHDRLWFEQRPPRDFDFDG